MFGRVMFRYEATADDRKNSGLSENLQHILPGIYQVILSERDGGKIQTIPLSIIYDLSRQITYWQ
ncbi:MAG: hypothetical protein KDC53_07500 [Saprospiraceae bacterium]|nr:hypothetical protein [Saprospiraceae bacterium]